VGDFWKERWCRGEWGWRRRMLVWEEDLLKGLVDAFLLLVLTEENDASKWG
jgi:hypothetical protein